VTLKLIKCAWLTLHVRGLRREPLYFTSPHVTSELRYGGVLASASIPSDIAKRVKLRLKISPKEEGLVNKGPETCVYGTSEREVPPVTPKRSPYHPSAELLARTLNFEVLQCPKCRGRRRLLAMLTEVKELTRRAS
jgi:hypothetical protein